VPSWCTGSPKKPTGGCAPLLDAQRFSSRFQGFPNGCSAPAWRRSGFFLALAIGLACLVSSAAAVDRRVVVDPNQPPWSAIVKVQTNIGLRCTGAVIAPATVLTAAHCLYNPRTRAFLQPVSLHVLLGYERGEYRWHRLVARFVAAPGYAPGRPGEDWARLELAEPIPATVAPLPLAQINPAPGVSVMLAGYNQDRAQLLMTDPSCEVVRVIGQPDGATLIAHNCQGTRGTSGAPLLVRQGQGWAVLGINIGAGTKVNLALAVKGSIE
jgi:protease YdgD